MTTSPLARADGCGVVSRMYSRLGGSPEDVINHIYGTPLLFTFCVTLWIPRSKFELCPCTNMSRLLPSLDRPAGIRYKRLIDPEHEVRVLEIQRAKRLEDAVVSRLITVSPTKASFDIIGLSSLDGDPETTDVIYIDNKPVNITAHREEALRTIRELFLPASPAQRSRPSSREASRTTKTRLPQKVRRLLGAPKQKALYVWLDAICINQGDPREASRRRETMRTVYQSAKSVLGWLGPKIDETDAGLAVFDQIDECMPLFWGDPGDRDMHPQNYAPTHAWAAGIRSIWATGEDGSLPFTKPHWVGANDFLYRPYFQKQCTYWRPTPALTVHT